jgi:iron complex outermembrane receptor protein
MTRTRHRDYRFTGTTNTMSCYRITTALAVALLIAFARPLFASEGPPPSASLTGHIVDAETKEPIGWATVTLVELARAERSHRDGSFHFEGIPAGHYTVRVSFIGFETTQRQVDLEADRSADVRIELRVTALSTQTVVVTGDRIRAAATRPSEVITGTRLQQQLGRTLAETIGSEAGVAQRTMGPATARPVVRGLGGDRLQLLEDGAQSGDLSSASSDHAVTIDPLNAERIEIVQGPASLLYTANALGGVVNLVRNRIASVQPDRVHGLASLQGESVNAGYTGGLTLSLPLGPLALQLDGSGRRAGDISTPAGALGNTDYSSYNGSVGLSYVAPWGVAGAAGGMLRTEYGVPAGMPGDEEGVRIAMRREFGEGSVDVLPELSLIRRIELRGSYSRYRHDEIEAGGDVGTAYHLASGEITALAHHDTLGPFAHGSVGLRYEGRSLEATGVSVPPSREQTIAAMAYEEAPFDRLTVRGAIRFDHHVVAPDSDRAASIGFITQRAFDGASGSLALLYDVSSALQLGVTAMRSFRTPTIDELFSEGEHLASYSYEVGNPSLGVETGFGLEAAARYTNDHGHLGLTFFRNDIDGYIYPRNTGDSSAELRLPIYQETGAHVVMQGFEATAEWELIEHVVASGSLSFVRGDIVTEDRPLPTIPPLGGRFGLRYAWRALTIGAELRGAARQERLGEFETPTDGYVVANAFAQVQYLLGSMMHTVVLSVDNATDTEYRNHLSRTKAIMPEPGRNVRLLYRLYF